MFKRKTKEFGLNQTNTGLRFDYERDFMHKLLGMIHRKSSMHLIQYINNHPVSADEARREIMYVKQVYAGASRTLQVLNKMACTSPENFTFDNGSEFSMEYTINTLSVSDEVNRSVFCADYIRWDDGIVTHGTKVYANKGVVLKSNKILIAENINDWRLFMYTFFTLRFFEKNREQLLKELEMEEDRNDIIGMYK